MPEGLFARKQIEEIRAQVRSSKMTLVIIRTEKPPPELAPKLRSLARTLGLAMKRTYSAPASDFGIAELNSKDRMLIVLWVGGPRTELVSVSETDEAHVHQLEESIHTSNFFSDLVREGT